MKLQCVSALTLALAAAAAGAQEVDVTMTRVDAQGTGEAIGTVRLRDTAKGLELRPALTGLPAGRHGLHVHETGSCAPAMKDGKPEAAGAAGGHLDPAKTGRHAGPTGRGHLGDLPVLVVAADGAAKQAVLAPRLKLADVRGKALMVHAGGDNLADKPEPLGGGGARVACGVVGR